MQSYSVFQLNKDILEHLNNCSLLKIKNYDSIYLTQLINSDCNTICTFIFTKLQEILINLLKIIVPLIILIKLTPYMLIIFIFFIILYYLIFNFFKNKLYNCSKILTELKSEFFSNLCKILTNIKSIKIQCIESYIFNLLQKDYDKLLKKTLNNQSINWAFTSSEQFISTFLQTIIFITCGINLIKDNITIGDFTFLLSYFTMILSSIKYFYNLRGTFQNVLVSYHRILEFLNFNIEKNGNIYINTIKTISIKNLKFSYSKDNLMVFHDIKFEKGKIYYLLGENGIGKTTLIDLLCGLYIEDYYSSISINDINIKEINMKFVRKYKITYFEQNFATINRNIEDNLLLLIENHKVNEIFYINKKVKFFIDSKLEKLILNSCYIKDMSMGEKQKISLLIFLVKNTEIFILDEPTNFLDEDSMNNLFNYLHEIKLNKIILIITHNLEFLKKCDFIYNLK